MSAKQRSETILAVEEIIQYRFHDENILWEALQAAGTSVVTAGGPVHPDGNKRPAIVGDVVLKLSLVEDWYHTGTVKGLHLVPFKVDGEC